jgi:hypothetical protein
MQRPSLLPIAKQIEKQAINPGDLEKISGNSWRQETQRPRDFLGKPGASNLCFKIDFDD